MSVQTAESFSYLRCDNSSVKNAVFLLSAPNSAWLKNADWAHGTIPCDMKIIYRANKSSTPLVQRIGYLYKKVKKIKNKGGYHKNLAYLQQTNAVQVLKGEVLNEEVMREREREREKKKEGGE